MITLSWARSLSMLLSISFLCGHNICIFLKVAGFLEHRPWSQGLNINSPVLLGCSARFSLLSRCHGPAGRRGTRRREGRGTWRVTCGAARAKRGRGFGWFWATVGGFKNMHSTNLESSSKGAWNQNVCEKDSTISIHISPLVPMFQVVQEPGSTGEGKAWFVAPAEADGADEVEIEGREAL